MDYTIDTNTQEVIETTHPADVVKRRTMQSYLDRMTTLEEDRVIENDRHTEVIDKIDSDIAIEQAGFDAGLAGGLPDPRI